MARRAVVLLVLAFTLPASGQEREPDRTPIEQARRAQKRPGMLGTKGYEPSEAEKPFLEALPEAERVTGSHFDGYDPKGRKGSPVGWFGIVRKIEIDPGSKRTDLLVEMKYFDGLTDTHIQLVSLHGGGDFRARLRGTDLPVQLLSLVRVYGKVVAEGEGVPVVEATFVRQWDWGHFTFMAYGPPAGNPRWRELVRVSDDDAYRPFPDQRFYELRVGSRKTIKLYDLLGEKVFDALAKDMATRLRKNEVLRSKVELAQALKKLPDEILVHGLVGFLTRAADGPKGYGGPEPEQLVKRYDLTPAVCRTVVTDLEAAVGALGLPGEPATELVNRLRKTLEPFLREE